VLILWDLAADATFHVARKGCAGASGRWHVSASGIPLILLSLVLIGCASRSLVPAAQSAAITQREQALASHADAIQTAVRQSGSLGALAFLDAGDGRLVVLPGDSPADAWARYVASPERETRPASIPPVVTFVYRADVPKAPESITWVALQQERTSAAALVTDLRRLEERLSAVQGELAATKLDTDKAVAEVRAIAEDLAGVRKFMLQTAQLGWLNHELTLENAGGVRRMAATSQELVASSARLEETLRQLSENLSGQLKELAARLDGIQGKIQNIK
jgi:hypothetical protein